MTEIYLRPRNQISNVKKGEIMDEGDFLNMDQETFHRLLKKFLVKKCECGAILPSYPYYTETTEYVVCGNCAKTYERKRS